MQTKLYDVNKINTTMSKWEKGLCFKFSINIKKKKNRLFETTIFGSWQMAQLIPVPMHWYDTKQQWE